jgi:hypothetical protein
VITYCGLVDGSVRDAYIQKPFEQLTRLVTWSHFDEPYKFLASKTNSDTDTIDISLPLELNHPTQEIIWVFRRKGVAINNEWANFTPLVETQRNPIRVPKEWLVYATLRVNGSVVEQTPRGGVVVGLGSEEEQVTAQRLVGGAPNARGRTRKLVILKKSGELCDRRTDVTDASFRNGHDSDA